MKKRLKNKKDKFDVELGLIKSLRYLSLKDEKRIFDDEIFV